MSRQINQPINQVKLTNVATVRYNKMGKRFEIACYRNKVVNYRQGIETDLEEVLQTERVFSNVSKGEFANKADLLKVFQTTNQEEIIELILRKGDLQISDLERQDQFEAMGREIATWISEHGVHPVTNRPYTVAQIRQAMKQAEYTIHPTGRIKKQYLDCFKKIKTVLNIVRAKMKLQLDYSAQHEATVCQVLEQHSITPETRTASQSDEQVLQLLVDPSLYRPLEELAQKIGGQLKVLQQVVMREGDADLNQELKENQLQRDDHDIKDLSSQLDASLLLDDASPSREDLDVSGNINNDGPGDDDEDDYAPNISSRQSHKRAQKKSKKQKRREKEQAEERQVRIDAETKRRETRAALRGEDVATATHQGKIGSNDQQTKPCNTCGGSFVTTAEYRAHFRSDWHRYNVKLKMKNVQPVTEEEFVLVDSDAFFDTA